MLGQHSTASASSSLRLHLAKAVAKVFARRPSTNLRRKQNATFSGTASDAAPVRQLSETFCCLPALPPSSPPASSPRALLESPSSASQRSSSTELSHNLRVQGWMFWARPEGLHGAKAARRCRNDPETKCFTKVFAVLRNEFLLLYRSQHKFARYSAATENPLVHIAVSKATALGGGKFVVEGPQRESMVLHVFEHDNQARVDMWKQALAHAVELTRVHFAQSAITADNLPRNSMFRGSLHDLRQAKTRPSLRGSFTDRLHRFSSSKPPTTWIRIPNARSRLDF